MKVGIIGFGVVGQAVGRGLAKQGYVILVNDVVEERGGFTKRELMDQCDIIFICVPTPSHPDGSIDLNILFDVIIELDQYTDLGNPIIAIKSTVIPGTTRELIHAFPKLTFIYTPEFLRAKSADHDFLHPDRIIIGFHRDHVCLSMISELYQPWINRVYYTDTITAETIKYVANAFLVLKVAFACEMDRICKVLDAASHVVFMGVTQDHRIHQSHLNPRHGPINQNSPCLPKDLLALITHLESKGYDSTLLKTVYALGVKS